MTTRRTIYGDIDPIPEPTPTKKGASLVVEPRVGYWTQNNNWGTVKDLRVTGYPMAAGVVPILQNTQLPGPPRCRSIFLERTDTRINSTIGSGVGQGSNFHVLARIRYGTGGSLREFYVDWSSCNLQVVASTVQVDAYFKALDESLAYSNAIRTGGTGLSPVLSVLWGGELVVNLGSDPSPFNGDNTLTQYVPSVALLSSYMLAVPYGATAFSVSLAASSNPPASDGVLAFFNEPGSIATSPFYGTQLGTLNLLTLTSGSYQLKTVLPGSCKGLRFLPGSVVTNAGPFYVTWYLGV